MKWFRLYTEARSDLKLARLSPEEHLVWFHLLCYAAEQDERGEICFAPDDYEILAIEVARGDEDLLRRTLEHLRKLKIILMTEEAGACCILFPHFLERQYDKPSDRPESTAERKRRQRAESLSRDVTRCHAPYSEADADAIYTQKQSRAEQSKQRAPAREEPAPEAPSQPSQEPPADALPALPAALPPAVEINLRKPMPAPSQSDLAALAAQGHAEADITQAVAIVQARPAFRSVSDWTKYLQGPLADLRAARGRDAPARASPQKTPEQKEAERAEAERRKEELAARLIAITAPYRERLGEFANDTAAAWPVEQVS